jgi:chloramphenicol-sensitive protein RarD
MTHRSNMGVASGAAAFLIWGFAPIYWKALGTVPSVELLAHRVVWAVPCLVGLLLIRRRWGAARAAVADRQTRLTLLGTTVLIALNWFIFIWAVNSGRVLHASIGYFINPLINVLLGYLVLGERLRRLQWFAVGLAAVGVALVTLRAGDVPWVALVLALSFGFYGLLRKTVRADAVTGLWLETTLLFPLAAAYLLGRELRGVGHFGHEEPAVNVLISLAGLVTVVPLVLFTMGARRLRLTTVGLLQYLAPTGHFLLAVFLYREPFTPSHLLAFVFIWSGLVLYSVEARVHLADAAGGGARPDESPSPAPGLGRPAP